MSDLQDDTPVLGDRELEAWPAATPPESFADRVLAARTRAAAPRPRRRGPWIIGAGATTIALAAAAAILTAALRPRGGTVERGTMTVTARKEAKIGERAVFVAEPGASLRWTVEPSGAAHIDQDSGDVFYRVERGGPFVVTTPAGEVTVLGTCFRVEVTEMRSIGKQGVAGAAIGAAVTAVVMVMVTAYEGKVLLANEKGKAQIVAGERSSATAGNAPMMAAGAKRAPLPAVAVAPPPTEGASRAELLARDADQRKQIAKLQAQIAELSDDAHLPRLDAMKFSAHPSHDELVEMAKSCTLSYDNAPLDPAAAALSPSITARAHLDPAETAAVQKVIDETNARVLAQLRALYVEVTGNKASAEELSAQALMNEIQEKTGRAEADAARSQLANERAGLSPPPADLTSRSPSERMFRLLSSQGDDLEKAVGQVVGADRAAALRGQGWGARSMMSGCKDSGEDKEGDEPK